MAPCMKPRRSAVVRLPQLPMKRPPLRAEASLRPPRSSPWHPAQLAWYAVRPASTCACVMGAVWAAGCWPMRRAAAPSDAPAMAIGLRLLMASMLGSLLLDKPAPQDSLRSLFAVEFEIETVVFGVDHLRFGEFHHAGDLARGGFLNREIGDLWSAYTRGDCGVQFGSGGIAKEAVET